MKQIPLTQGKVAIVDDENFDWLNQWKWSVLKQPHSKNWYAVRTAWNGNRWHTIRMHRLILEIPLGSECDHINHNGLDNRKSNLRICTHQENMRNMTRHKNSASGIKGVTWDKSKGKWLVQIQIDKKRKFFGRFVDKAKAIQKYNEMAKKHFGEFA